MSTSAEATDLRCTCFRTARAARRLSQFYEAEMAGKNVSPVQMILLAELDRSGPMTVKKLAQSTGTDQSTLSRTIARMDREGWLAEHSGTDRRARHIGLSESGRRALVESGAGWRRAENAIARKLGARKLETLYSLLAEVEHATDQ